VNSQSRLKDFDAVRRHPDVKLLIALLEDLFVLDKEVVNCRIVFSIDKQSHKAVLVKDSFLRPFAPDGLCFAVVPSIEKASTTRRVHTRPEPVNTAATVKTAATAAQSDAPSSGMRIQASPSP
jgi:hypothetical protein